MESSFLKEPVPLEAFCSLTAEADRLAPKSEYLDERLCFLDADGGINGRGRAKVSGPGDALGAFHKGGGLEIARRFSGVDAELFPTRSAYLYYVSGDYDFFHYDNIQAHITLIVGLSGEINPLIMYPNFGTPSANDVDELNSIRDVSGDALNSEMLLRFGERAKSYTVDLSVGQAVAIHGRRIPHARVQQDREARLCTACYALLVPPAEWLNVST